MYTCLPCLILGCACFTLWFTGEYPRDYDDAIPSGVVELTFKSTGAVEFKYELTDTDAACEEGPDSEVKNSCGIHIHAGTSCGEDLEVCQPKRANANLLVQAACTVADALGEDACSLVNVPGGCEWVTVSQVGGHYWNSDVLMEDPWTFDAYYTTGKGATRVFFGEDAASAIGRVLVLHNKAGARISCRVIPQPETVLASTSIEGKLSRCVC